MDRVLFLVFGVLLFSNCELFVQDKTEIASPIIGTLVTKDFLLKGELYHDLNVHYYYIKGSNKNFHISNLQMDIYYNTNITLQSETNVSNLMLEYGNYNNKNKKTFDIETSSNTFEKRIVISELDDLVLPSLLEFRFFGIYQSVRTEFFLMLEEKNYLSLKTLHYYLVITNTN